MNNSTILIQVSKKEVMESNIGPFKDVFKQYQEMLGNLDNNLIISFDGFDNDPREIWQIPQCVKYFYGIAQTKGALRALKIEDPSNLGNHHICCMANFTTFIDPTQKPLQVEDFNTHTLLQRSSYFTNICEDQGFISEDDHKYVYFKISKQLQNIAQ